MSDDCAAARRTRTRCVVEEESVCRAVVRAAGTFPKIAEVDERGLHPAPQPVPNRYDDHARPAAKAAAGWSRDDDADAHDRMSTVIDDEDGRHSSAGDGPVVLRSWCHGA